MHGSQVWIGTCSIANQNPRDRISHLDEFAGRVLARKLAAIQKETRIQSPTVSRYVLADLRHCVADVGIRSQQVMMLGGIPLQERWQLLGYRLKQSDNHANWCCLHVIAELVDSRRIRHPVVTIELHALPDGKKYCGKYEYRRPVLEFVAAVDTRVK